MTDSATSDWYVEGLRFTCTQCGNCCTGPTGYVWFTPEEARAMAAAQGLEVETFLERFARRIHGRWSLKETVSAHGFDCVFLRRDAQGRTGCAVYTDRPRQCRTWPFWPENLAGRRAWEGAAARCPGMAAGNRGQGRHYTYQQIRIIRDGQSPT